MKRLILSSMLIPFVAWMGINGGRHRLSPDQVEIRSGKWPILLEKSTAIPGAAYSLQFRDQQVVTGVVMDTLPFPNLVQLKYFEEALSTLKTGNNGDIAKFKDYSIKRAEVKREAVWYILRIKWGLTNFQQPESDIMIRTIKNL